MNGQAAIIETERSGTIGPCDVCGAPLPPQTRGRPRLYCGDVCRELGRCMGRLHLLVHTVQWTPRAARRFRREVWTVGNDARPPVDDARNERRAAWGATLVQARLSLGLSQRQVAGWADMHPRRLDALERGRRPASDLERASLALALAGADNDAPPGGTMTHRYEPDDRVTYIGDGPAGQTATVRERHLAAGLAYYHLTWDDPETDARDHTRVVMPGELMPGALPPVEVGGAVADSVETLRAAQLGEDEAGSLVGADVRFGDGPWQELTAGDGHARSLPAEDAAQLGEAGSLVGDDRVRIVGREEATTVEMKGWPAAPLTVEFGEGPGYTLHGGDQQSGPMTPAERQDAESFMADALSRAWASPDHQVGEPPREPAERMQGGAAHLQLVPLAAGQKPASQPSEEEATNTGDEDEAEQGSRP